MKYKQGLRIGFFLLWFALFGGMHLACFDIFQENLWYFYLLAIMFFLFQMLIVVVFQRKNCFWPLWVYAVIYGIVLVFKDCYFLICIFGQFSKDTPIGLDILCLLCDLAGLVICCLGLSGTD